jgi:hypothetical protein
MKPLLSALALTIVFGVGMAFGQETTAELAKFESWTTYTSPEGDFNIRFPGKPNTRQEPYNQNASYLQKNFVSYSPTRERLFEVSYVDFRGQMKYLDEFQERGLTTIADTMVSRGGTVLSQGPVSRGGCQGKELIVRAVNPATQAASILKMRTFSSGTLVFSVFYGGGSDSPAEVAIADQFLDSFSVIGGCKRVPASAAGSTGATTIAGMPESKDGWQRYDSPSGVSFLFPGSAQTTLDADPDPASPLRRFFYGYFGTTHGLAVIVYEGYKASSRTTPSQMKSAEAQAMRKAREELETNRYQVGECRPFHAGLASGSECDITMVGTELTGRARVVATATREIILIGFRGTASSDTEPIDRFFSSVRIDPR